MNVGLAEMQFPAVLRGLLALFSLFLVDIPSRSQLFLPTPPSLFLRKCGQITRPIFSKSGDTYRPDPCGSANVIDDEKFAGPD